jgi:uncharacterized protein YjiS (DUF1127 family)
MKQLTYEEINSSTGRSSGTDAIEVPFENMLATLRRWRQRSAQRRRLAGLSICLLDDIGITNEKRLEEIGKPFWRA